MTVTVRATKSDMVTLDFLYVLLNTGIRFIFMWKGGLQLLYESLRCVIKQGKC